MRSIGTSDWFNVQVGLHQGSAMSPFLFALVLDRWTDNVRQESPWNLMYADDIVICEKTREQLEISLENWRQAIERRGIKISRCKTEYVGMNQESGGAVSLQGLEEAKVDDFKYLGFTVQGNREVKKRVQAAWNSWRSMTGILCDKKIPARVKGKVYKTAVRPAMLYGLETIATTKR